MIGFYHRLRTPNEWADKFWGTWDIFGPTISTLFGTVSPLSMFSIIQPLFLQKTKSLYHHPKYFLGRKELGISPSCVRSPCSVLWLKVCDKRSNNNRISHKIFFGMCHSVQSLLRRKFCKILLLTAAGLTYYCNFLHIVIVGDA